MPVVSSGFAGQAKYQADMLNLSDVRVAFVRHPISDATPQEMASKAEESWGDVAMAIQSDEPLKVPDWAQASVSSQECST